MPGTWTRRRTTAGLLALAVLVLASCSAADEAATTDDAAAPAPGGRATEAPADDADGGDADEGGEDAAAGVVQIGAPLGRKVIRTAELELAVRDTAAAVDRATSLAERAGGFVARAELTRQPGEQLEGSLTLRVPTRELTSTLAALEELAVEVRSKHLGSDDVTEEYSDIEAQLRNLRALESELLELLGDIRDRSDSADEILRVFERVRQVREEIETLEGRKQVLDDLVDLATVDLRLVPASEGVPLAAEGWSPATVARDALRTTVGALQGLADVAIWIVLTVLPITLVLALPLGLGWYALRRWRGQPVTRRAE